MPSAVPAPLNHLDQAGHEGGQRCVNTISSTSLPTFKRPRVNAAMSFGFSVGDFLTVIQLANKIRKDFAGAPSEFKGALDV